MISQVLEKVVFLGSASGQTKSLEPVSFLIVSSTVVLVETGPSIIRQLESAGLRPKDLSAVFVTHVHADHALGFAYLAFNKHIDRIENGDASASLPVYGISDVLEGLKTSTAIHYPPGSFPTYQVSYLNLDQEPEGELPRGFAYAALAVKHTVPNVALKITTPGGKRVVYSSDTIYDPALVELSASADLLIHEAMLPSSAEELSRRLLHATISDAARAAQDAGARRLALVHMIPSLFNQEREVLAEVAASYQGSAVFAREGTTVEL